MAVNNSTGLAVFQARTPGVKKGIRVLWESPLVPKDVLMVRKDAPEAVKALVKAIFSNYGKNFEAEREQLKKASGIAHFVPATNQLLEPVSEFKFATERAGVQASPAPADEKAKQLVRIDERCSFLS